MENGKVTEHALDDRANEFPRINESLVGKPNRYGYTMSSDAHGTHSLQKTDLTTDAAQQHILGKGRHTGEAVFVASPDAKSEDDGWLLSHVHDNAEQRSEVLIVDAQEFDQPPVARVVMPQRVPYGFHALWVDGVNL